MKRLLAVALPGALLAAAAAADAGPQLIPTRDVEITYRVTRNGRTLDERVRWLAADQLERVDAAGAIYMIVDHKVRRLTLVNDARRAVLEMAVPPGRLLDPEAASRYTRAGDGQVVAGLPCTNWRLPTGDDAAKQLCVTPDGVVLQIQDRGQTIAEATAVDYRAMSPDAFRVPVGYAQAPPPAAAPPPDTGAAPAER
ncbi:MAG: hypothetical protein JO047_11660 [Alphaproteobacteria bacterium]|nr:hypothetical protein [Alphaproteobacteria bacterium]